VPAHETEPGPPPRAALDETATTLTQHGFVRVPGRWTDHAAAWRRATLIAEQARDLDPLHVGLPAWEPVGEFTLPPPGFVQRDFQALHIDYGLPVLAGPPLAVSRFTALYLDGQQAGSGAATRIVPLRPLLAQRSWPVPEALKERLTRAADGDHLVEGIMARIIESADQSQDLPDRDTEGFLCGMEFATLDEERDYFAQHGLDLPAAEQEIVLDPGELLLFDNLAVTHGRRGRRATGELHQLCLGFASLDLDGQTRLLDRFLASFRPSDR
jgi:hypothetical protein